MYIIERNAERTDSAGRLLYDMWVKVCHSAMLGWSFLYQTCAYLQSMFLLFRFLKFPDQPTVWREISVITAALRSDTQDKHAQFLRGRLK